MPAWALKAFKEKIAQKGSCGYHTCLTVVVLQETNRKPVCYSHCDFSHKWALLKHLCWGVGLLGSYWEISQSMELANETSWITSHRLLECSWVSISAVCSEVNRCAVGSTACVCIAHRLWESQVQVKCVRSECHCSATVTYVCTELLLVSYSSS